MNISLYTGPNCSLCDRAMEVIAQLHMDNITVQTINIRENRELYHLYALRIPVIKRQDTLAELNWPFTLAELRSFLS